MSAPDFAIYSSGHSDVLDAWVTHAEKKKAWFERVEAAMKDWGFDHTEVLVSASAWGPATMLGVKHYGKPPEFWRHPETRFRDRIVPYRSKVKGNAEIVKRFDSLSNVPDLRRDLMAYGMPYHCFSGLSVTAPDIAMNTIPAGPSSVWVKWHGCEPEVTGDWWRRVKLTDYYALVETGKDPFAKDESSDD